MFPNKICDNHSVMRQRTPPNPTPGKSRVRLYLQISSVAVLLLLLNIGFFSIKTNEFVFRTQSATQPEEVATKNDKPVPFPLGVNPARKEITENANVETYFNEQIASKNGGGGAHTTWLHKAVAKLALSGWYQNLASPISRMLVIQSGERKEQIAENFGKILGWDKSARTTFLELIASATPMMTEGKFFPATYVVNKGATPADVAPLILDRFNGEILSRYGSDIERVVPLEDALTIASILEREAYDFEDMRQISGVIWNRLFSDMNLQIDATLQYAKGSKTNQPWWPRVLPSDKYIDSPFNTYKNEGLPPAPIANPSLDAILAALNPTNTECLFYFHDKNAGFHCTKTYEEHVALLKEYYGRGK